MNYKITVEKIDGKDDRGYDNTETIYEQKLEELDVASLAIFLNKTELLPPLVIRKGETVITKTNHKGDE